MKQSYRKRKPYDRYLGPIARDNMYTLLQQALFFLLAA